MECTVVVTVAEVMVVTVAEVMVVVVAEVMVMMMVAEVMVLMKVTRSKGDSWLSPFRKLPCGSLSLTVDLFSLCMFPAPELTGSNLEVVQETG